jgi:hypothetical protein
LAWQAVVLLGQQGWAVEPVEVVATPRLLLLVQAAAVSVREPAHKPYSGSKARAIVTQAQKYSLDS